MAGKAEQGKMVVAEVGRQHQLLSVRNLLFAEEVAQAQMVVSEEGDNLLLRIEKFQPQAIVGQAETDKAVVD